MEKATLGGGCFWCLDAAFRQVEGVQEVVAGYAGGDVESPSYEEVCSGRTGHAEVVQVGFDPDVIGYDEVLEIFFTIHDPTQRDRQGADVGTQYRSIILTHDERQAETARGVIDEVRGLWDGAVVTAVEPLERFYPAEEHHQDYFARNPHQAYCAAVIQPKLQKLRRKWQHRLKA